MNTIFNEIKQYIESDILPKYQFFDKTHSSDHINKVIESSMEIASDFEVNMNMVYTIAAYHDIGIGKGRADHEYHSSLYLEADSNLKKWYPPEEIIIMKEALEDHRASSKREPRSIYGKIVAEADRDIHLTIILFRTYQYGIKYFPDLNFDEQFERVYSHIQDKYGENGYLQLWLHTAKNLNGLQEIREALKDKRSMKELCRNSCLER